MTRCRFVIHFAVAMAIGWSAVSSNLAIAQPGATLPSIDSSAPSATELKTVALVGLKSYDDMIGDVNYLGSLAGKPEIGAMVEGTITLLTQGRGLQGLDRGLPWGVILQTDGQQFLPLLCLPVRDLNTLVELLAAFQIPVEDGADGIKKIALPQGTVFMQQKGPWVFATMGQSAAALDSAPANPGPMLSALVVNNDFGARIWVQNIPEMFRTIALKGLMTGLEEKLVQKENESTEQFEIRSQMVRSSSTEIIQFIEEVDQLTLGTKLDTKNETATGTFSLTAVPGTKMAKQMDAYQNTTTSHAGFFQPDAGLMMLMTSKFQLEPVKLQQLQTSLDGIRKKMHKEMEQKQASDEQKQLAKDAANNLLDAVFVTIKAGIIDGGMLLNSKPAAATLVIGGTVQETDKIESAIRNMSKLAEMEGIPGIQWNVANHAGIQFHTFSSHISEGEKELRRLFGPSIQFAIGIGENEFYIAAGKECLATTKGIIDRSRETPNKAIPPFTMSSSLGSLTEFIAELANENQRAQVVAIGDMLRADSQGRDHVRILAQPIPNGVRYRFMAEGGVLRAIGAAAAAMQQAGVQLQ